MQPPLGAFVVTPLRMNRELSRKVFPEYTVVDSTTGTRYRQYNLFSGGEDKLRAVLAGYMPAEDRYTTRTMVLKAIPHTDRTEEGDKVGRAGHFGALVEARVVQRAQKPAPGAAVGPEHFTVVLMHYRGVSLAEEVPLSREGALLAAQVACRACQTLAAHGLAYLDLKPQNMLRYAGTVQLCDYGALEALGSTTAVSSHPPAHAPRGVLLEATEEAMVHSLGTLLLCLTSLKANETLLHVPPSAQSSIPAARRQLAQAHAEALQALKAEDAVLHRVVKLTLTRGVSLADVSFALQLELADAASRRIE
jgi:hypothetical protein